MYPYSDQINNLISLPSQPKFNYIDYVSVDNENNSVEINCIVDDEAMIEALKNGTVFAYGLDVYNGEPKIHPEYLKLKNIFLLPHLGSATKRTRWDMAFRATKNLEMFFKGEKPQDLVN